LDTLEYSPSNFKNIVPVTIFLYVNILPFLSVLPPPAEWLLNFAPSVFLDTYRNSIFAGWILMKFYDGEFYEELLSHFNF
jgi:hypothetical protein